MESVDEIKCAFSLVDTWWCEKTNTPSYFWKGAKRLLKALMSCIYYLSDPFRYFFLFHIISPGDALLLIIYLSLSLMPFIQNLGNPPMPALEKLYSWNINLIILLNILLKKSCIRETRNSWPKWIVAPIPKKIRLSKAKFAQGGREGRKICPGRQGRRHNFPR